MMGGWLALEPPLPGVPEPLALLALPALPAFDPLLPGDGCEDVLPGLLAGVWGRTDALFSPRGG